MPLEQLDKKKQSILRNNKGAALLMALFTVMLIIFIAVEVSYDTAVEYRVATADYQRLKAYYAAKSGVELSLLRIQLYQAAYATFKDPLKGQTQILDLIWQFPFMWPPSLGADLGRVSREEIQDSVKESFLDATYVTQIESEGAKIDINDLASPSEALRKATRQQLTQLLENRIQGEDDWAKDNSNLNIEELINNMQDWVDEDDISLNGGAERSQYPDAKSTFIPPNQPFKTLQELHMVKGITDALYQIIAPQVTVYGLKGINVNYADKKILMSIDPAINEDVATEILSRRSNPEIGPFKDANDFNSFLTGPPGNIDINTFNKSQIPLYFDAEYNFRIKSIGQFGNSTREIIAIVYDFDTVKERLEKILATTTSSSLAQQGTPAPGTTTPTTSTSSTTLQTSKSGSGRPTVIYWHED